MRSLLFFDYAVIHCGGEQIYCGIQDHISDKAEQAAPEIGRCVVKSDGHEHSSDDGERKDSVYQCDDKRQEEHQKDL